MTELFSEIEQKFKDLAIENAKVNNISAIRRSRRIALELRKLLHEYRKNVLRRIEEIKNKNKQLVESGARKARKPNFKKEEKKEYEFKFE